PPYPPFPVRRGVRSPRVGRIAASPSQWRRSQPLDGSRFGRAMPMNAITNMIMDSTADGERPSTDVRAEINQLIGERDWASDRLAQLQATYDEAVLAGDEEAERHEVEMTAVRRAIRRVELGLPILQLE